MPIDYKRYPNAWKELSRRIRFERAKGRCEQCGAKHGSYIYRIPDSDGEYATTTWHSDRCTVFDKNGAEVDEIARDDVNWIKPTKVILTVAHLNHDITDNRDENLRALCQRCHLRHDIEQHQRSRAETRRRNQGLQSIPWDKTTQEGTND